jgi:hypothetical protein
MSRGPKIINDIEAFHCKYIVNEETGCWQWIGYISPRGYGQFRFNKKNYQAHRFSYEYYVNEIEKDMIIMHLCDNPKCVNYNHLKVAYQKDNIKDCIEKNRKARGNKLPNSKLNDNQIVEIKLLLQNPYLGLQKDLAIKYNVTQTLISRIKKNIAWSHIKI